MASYYLILIVAMIYLCGFVTESSGKEGEYIVGREYYCICKLITTKLNKSVYIPNLSHKSLEELSNNM